MSKDGNLTTVDWGANTDWILPALRHNEDSPQFYRQGIMNADDEKNLLMTDIFKDSGDWSCNNRGPSGMTQLHMTNGQQPLGSAPKGTVALWSEGHVKLMRPYRYPTDPCL